MPKEGVKELKTLTPEALEHPAAVEMQIMLMMRLSRWKAALAASRKLCRVAPEMPVGYIHSAFCLHELGETRKALETLLGGPRTLEKEGTYFYNLACYEAVLGDLASARKHLAKSILIDKRFRDYAKGDADLAKLHAELE